MKAPRMSCKRSSAKLNTQSTEANQLNSLEKFHRKHFTPHIHTFIIRYIVITSEIHQAKCAERKLKAP